VQVKGGEVNRSDVATLLGDVEDQKAAGGLLITLEKPAKQMRTETGRCNRHSNETAQRFRLAAHLVVCSYSNPIISQDPDVLRDSCPHWWYHAQRFRHNRISWIGR
jgi:hypothetical protein